MRHLGIWASLIALSLLSVSAARAYGPAELTVAEYDNAMLHTPTPGQGCFYSNYPNTSWVKVACVTGNNLPATVGNGVDNSAAANSGTYYGFAQGQFSTATGVTSAYDTFEGANNYYSLQLNANSFSCTPLNGSALTESPGYGCWQQFLFENAPGTGNSGELFMQYWAHGYYSKYGKCPTSSWTIYSDPDQLVDCYTNSSVAGVPYQDPTSQLPNLELNAQANYQSSGDDQVALCNQGTCYSESGSDSMLSLYNDNWTIAEFNIFGTYDYSQVQFNTGTTIKPAVEVEDSSGSTITPVCDSTGFTGETSNLGLTSGSCSVSGTYEIMGFTETN